MLLLSLYSGSSTDELSSKAVLAGVHKKTREVLARNLKKEPERRLGYILPVSRQEFLKRRATSYPQVSSKYHQLLTVRFLFKVGPCCYRPACSIHGQRRGHRRRTTPRRSTKGLERPEVVNRPLTSSSRWCYMRHRQKSTNTQLGGP